MNEWKEWFVCSLPPPLNSKNSKAGVNSYRFCCPMNPFHSFTFHSSIEFTNSFNSLTLAARSSLGQLIIDGQSNSMKSKAFWWNGLLLRQRGLRPITHFNERAGEPRHPQIELPIHFLCFICFAFTKSNSTKEISLIQFVGFCFSVLLQYLLFSI